MYGYCVFSCSGAFPLKQICETKVSPSTQCEGETLLTFSFRMACTSLCSVCLLTKFSASSWCESSLFLCPHCKWESLVRGANTKLFSLFTKYYTSELHCCNESHSPIPYTFSSSLFFAKLKVRLHSVMIWYSPC